MNAAAKSLKSGLFYFNTSLRTSLLYTRYQFISLANTGLISVPGNTTFKLQDFIALQHEVHRDIRIQLDRLSVSILSSVRTACDEVRAQSTFVYTVYTTLFLLYC
jgi:hypothetical protein